MYLEFKKVFSVDFNTQTIEVEHNKTLYTYPMAYVTGRPNPDTLMKMTAMIVGQTINSAVAILFMPKEYGAKKKLIDVVNAQSVV